MLEKITDNIIYIGVNDYDIELFEGQYNVPNGIAYNSYVIEDYKTVVVDTVDKAKTEEWLQNIDSATRKVPDYLLIQHMEPDHSASIEAFMNKYPKTTLIGNQQIINMIGNFFPDLQLTNTLVVENGQSINLGKHNLTFVFTPMVHWPEVMMTYESTEKVLFSADGFGKFGAFDADESWTDEARRYYIGIVGKYGKQVQDVLKLAATLDINIICPTHGPVLRDNLGRYIELYDKWSSYTPEAEGVCLCYTSVYGGTKKAVEILREELMQNGVPNVVVFDLARCDITEAVAAAFKYNKLVLATTTYNGEIFPFMYTFVHYLTERNYQNRTVAIIENGSWAPRAAACIKSLMSDLQNIRFAQNEVTILSRLKNDDISKIKELAKELTREYAAAEVSANSIEPTAMLKIEYGMYVATTNDGNKDNGCIVNSVSQVSSTEPMIISVNVNKNNYTAQVIKETGHLNISVLDKTAPFEIFKHFGFQSGRDVDKFAVEKPVISSVAAVQPKPVQLDLKNENAVWSYATDYIAKMNCSVENGNRADCGGTSYGDVQQIGSMFVAKSSNGLYYLTKYANSYISAKVRETLDMGTHYMFICEVTESAILSNEKTLTYDYYRDNIKPQPAKKMQGYVCTICGYVYEHSTLPNDIICPLCKHGAEAFTPLK